MDSVFYQCPDCGGDLKDISASECECIYCGKKFKRQNVDEYEKRILEMLGRDKAERVAYLRRQLWDAVSSERHDAQKMAEDAKALLSCIPDDYFASFCLALTSGGKTLNDFLIASSVDDASEYADALLPVLFSSMQADNINATGIFLEKLVKADPQKFGTYSDDLEKASENLRSGLYEIAIPRDVFLAYSGADIEKVVELCDYLESHGISCFLALRNLRHGMRAKDSYKKALETAADNCKVVVFVSSVNSRNLACEALTYELPYIKSKDLQYAPPEYRYAYERLPAKYKMPRVEYLLDSYKGDVAETISKEFFMGVEWCTTKEAVGKRIVKYLTAVPRDSASTTTAGGKSSVKSDIADSDDVGATSVPKHAAHTKLEFEIKNGVLKKYNGNDVCVTIPMGVTTVEARAFFGNTNVTTVVMPNTVKVIGFESFAGCVRLASVKMSASLISIDSRAFAECVSLREIEIPVGVADMGKGVFAGDVSLQYIYCGSAALPRGWNSLWCQCKPKIVWGVRRS